MVRPTSADMPCTQVHLRKAGAGPSCADSAAGLTLLPLQEFSDAPLDNQCPACRAAYESLCARLRAAVERTGLSV